MASNNSVFKESGTKVLIIIAFILGSLVGFFGVFASVFSDGRLGERLGIIAVILLVYTLLNGFLGFWIPKYSWKWGIITGIQGVLVLGLYQLREYNLYYFLYMILIFVCSCFSGKIGSQIRNHKK